MDPINKKDLLYYKDQGEGKVLVLLHGYLESMNIWDELTERVIQNFRVISFDLPGHGKSKNLIADFSIDHMAEKVMDVIRSLNIDRFYTIGHSMGGYVALALLDFYPKHIIHSILLHSKASDDTVETRKKRDEGVLMLEKHPNLYIQEAIKGLFRPENRVSFKSEIDSLVKIASQRHVEGYIQALKAMKERPNRKPLLIGSKNISYIVGKHDPVIPILNSEKEGELLDSEQFTILKNCGHMGFIEEKEKCFKALLKHLK